MAQIHTLNRGRTIAQPGLPTVGVLETVELACGCRVHVGRRLDTSEAATGAMACSKAHLPMMDDFNDRFLKTLERPTSEPVAFVIDRVLDQTESDWKAKAPRA